MNIPIEVARAQGHHGVKGAVHGVKGGRPRLNLTDDERAQRERDRQAAYRRRKVQSFPPQRSYPGPVHPVRSVVGRNDPCTCGSGRKFKKCCGR